MMCRFIIKTVFIVATVLLIGLAFEMLVSYRLQSGSRFYFQNDWHTLSGHNADILYIGNSRVSGEINPFYVDSVFHTRSEVLAQDGQAIDILWYKFREYMKHNRPPQELYLLADPFSFDIRNGLLGAPSFSTYFFLNRVDMRFLYCKNGYHWYHTYLPLTAYKLNTMAKILKNDTVKESYEATHGFISPNSPFDTVNSDWNKPLEIKFNISERLVQHLDSFYTYCLTNNIKLYFICTPMSWPLYKNSTWQPVIDSLIRAKNLQYNYAAPQLNYNDSILYNEISLFYNHMHLNTKGVNVFMQQFTADTNAFTLFRNFTP